MKRGISKSFGKNEVFAFNIIIEKNDYRINGFSLERSATNEEMLHLTKDTLRVFQEIEHKITNRKRLHLSPEDKLLLTPEECQEYLKNWLGVVEMLTSSFSLINMQKVSFQTYACIKMQCSLLRQFTLIL